MHEITTNLLETLGFTNVTKSGNVMEIIHPNRKTIISAVFGWKCDKNETKIVTMNERLNNAYWSFRSKDCTTFESVKNFITATETAVLPDDVLVAADTKCGYDIEFGPETLTERKRKNRKISYDNHNKFLKETKNIFII